MKYWKPITVSLVSLIIGFTSCIYLSNSIYIVKLVNFYVTEDYVQIDAQGVLNLTNSQNAELRQFFILHTIDSFNNKLIMIEGLGDRKTIAFSRPRILDIVSKNSKQVIAKDDIWTVTIQKDNVTFLDKDGRTGELVSGFLEK